MQSGASARLHEAGKLADMGVAMTPAATRKEALAITRVVLMLLSWVAGAEG